MEGVPASIGNSGDDGVLAQSQQQPSEPLINDGGGGGGADELGEDGGAIGGGFTEDGDRSGGNRWPKQETLALIRIRSEMDAAFRDSNLKGPLWDDVSRKLSELGFHRSAKKCREKFENVYKYHRRTKEGRTSKPDKIYRFSDQLQALEQNPRGAFPPQPFPAVKPPPVLVNMSNNATVPSPFNVTGSDQNNVSPISVAAPAAVMAVMPPQPVMNHKRTFPFSQPQPNMSGSTNSATSSDTFSDDEPPQKKRKWQDFFGKLMKEVIEKQEELQKRFLDTIERRERDRVAREEAWRAQEIAKMNQEHDRLVKERSLAAAKDAAVITFLQKMTGKNPDTVDETRKRLADILAPPMPLTSTLPVIQQQLIHQTPPPPPRHEILQVAVPPPMVRNLDGDVSGGDNMLLPSPSRWPKAEINALITLRTQLDMNYQENTPKGPLWEEISAAMRKLGYNRNAKRCKEKWENINKYYKKMKDGNKKRPEDSKTCPYFHQLDAIYREKATAIVARPEQQWPPPATMVQEKTPPPPLQQQQQTTNAVYVEKGDAYPGFTGAPETQTAPVVAWPQQQWRVPAAFQETQQQPQSAADMEDQGSENTDDYDDDDEDDEDEDKEEEGGGYEIVASKISSVATV